MSEADEDIEAIREKKREALKRKLTGEAPQETEEGRSEVPSEPIYVEGATHLSELLSEYRLVLVDFYADWCGPCKMLEPTLDELANDPDLAVAKVDIDVHQRLAAQYSVQGVPNLLLFADGDPVDRIVGAQPKSRFEQAIEPYR